MDIIEFIGVIIALIALLASIYAIWITKSFNKHQLSLIAIQKELNKQILERGKREEFESKKAILGAKFVKLSRPGQYKLRIYNKGQAPARNIRIEFPEGNDVVDPWDIEEKFPMEVLEQQQSVDLKAFAGLDTKRKFMLLLMWADDSSETNEKRVYPTL